MAIYYVANIAALKAINTTDLPAGIRRVVGLPATGHLPSEYILFKSVNRAELQPLIVVPTTLTTDAWIAMTARLVTSTVAPSAAPQFVGQRWLNTAVTPNQLYEAVGVSSSAQWIRI